MKKAVVALMATLLLVLTGCSLGNSEKYIITYDIEPSISAEITGAFEDVLGKLSFEVPVDKEFYDSVEIGQVIENELTFGDSVIHGSFGIWRVSIGDKQIIEVKD